MDTGNATQQLPKYKCFKEVWALKIHDINILPDGGAMIMPAEKNWGPFKVEAEYVGKHNPLIGGYYVVYEDGYKSYSPAKAFEEGYQKIG